MATTPKDYNIQLDTKYKISGESITLVQGDNNGNIFHFALTENDEAIDLTGATVTITMVKSDNTVLVSECTVIDAVNGLCDYVVDIDALSALGQVIYTVEIYKNSGRTTTTQSKFKVIGELDDGTGAISQGNYNVLSTLIEKANNVITNEATRVFNEDNRIVNENARILNESTRQANENSRIEAFNEFQHYMDNQVTNATAYAISRGNYANEQGNNALSAASEARETILDYEDIVNETKKIYKPSVNTYADVLTEYPTPQIGWTVTAKDTGIEYRWDGVRWIDIGVSSAFDGYNVYIGPTPPDNVNLLWVPSLQGQGRYARIIPSEVEPDDRNQIWLKLS